MTTRALACAAFAATALMTTACGGGADPMTPKVCKVLKDVVAKAQTQETNPDMIQMWVVMGIANEAGEELEKMGAYVSKADAETEAACPDDRKKVLELSGKNSLESLIR